jgi:hypothetical protein
VLHIAPTHSQETQVFLDCLPPLLFLIFSIALKPLQNLGQSKKNTQCMHRGWECNPQQTKRVIAKTTGEIHKNSYHLCSF